MRWRTRGRRSTETRLEAPLRRIAAAAVVIQTELHARVWLCHNPGTKTTEANRAEFPGRAPLRRYRRARDDAGISVSSTVSRVPRITCWQMASKRGSFRKGSINGSAAMLIS